MFARSSAFVWLALAALPLAPRPQELTRPEGDPPRVAAAAPEVSVDYDLARTGIAWREGLDAALNRGKPVLLFQLLGGFSKVHC